MRPRKTVAVIGRVLGGLALMTVVSDLLVFDPRIAFFLSYSGLFPTAIAIFFLGILLGVFSWIIGRAVGDTFWRRQLKVDSQEVREFDWYELWMDLKKLLLRIFSDPLK